MWAVLFNTSSSPSLSLYDQLCEAIKKNNEMVVNDLIFIKKAPINPDPINAYTISPLYIAAALGLNDLVTLLINQGARINEIYHGDEKNVHGTPLYAAILNKHLDTAKILLDKKADVNMALEGKTLLCRAFEMLLTDKVYAASAIALLRSYQAKTTSKHCLKSIWRDLRDKLNEQQDPVIQALLAQLRQVSFSSPSASRDKNLSTVQSTSVDAEGADFVLVSFNHAYDSVNEEPYSDEEDGVCPKSPIQMC